jgi:quinol monooxygenase YgiN
VIRGGGRSGTAGDSIGAATVGGEEASMIFICAKWKVKPEYADQWVELSRDFTEATRAEEGNLFFNWSRSVDDPNEYVLIEAFKDDAAEAHVTSDHFKWAQRELPQYVQETPRVRNVMMEGDHWDRLVEFDVN